MQKNDERRRAKRLPLNSGGCAIINGDNIDIRTHSVSESGALVELIPHVPLAEGAKLRAHLNIGFIGRTKVCRTETRDDCTLYGIKFERFEFGSDRNLIEYFAQNEEELAQRAAAERELAETIFRIKECYPNKLIFTEGMEGDSAYIVKRGKVGISKVIDGHKVIIAELGPGTIFGELALLTKAQRRSATAEALEKTELVEIGRERFDRLVEKTPVVIVSILHALSKRVIELTGVIVRKETQLRRLQKPK